MREFANTRDAAIKSANENKVLTEVSGMTQKLIAKMSPISFQTKQNFIVQLAEQEKQIAELTQLNDQKDDLNQV